MKILGKKQKNSADGDVDEKLWAIDDKTYMEEPFGEMFFPSPSVGYSKVNSQKPPT